MTDFQADSSLVSTASNAAEQVQQVVVLVFSKLVKTGTGCVRNPDLTGREVADSAFPTSS
jgi:hypothetical protein